MVLKLLDSDRIWATLIVVLATQIVWYISKVIYRLFFHPLRKFPGPKLAAATFLYEAYFDILVPPYGQYIYQLERLHEKYGPVIRCSPDEIHVSDPSFFNTLYAGPGHIRDRWERSIRSNGAPGSVISAVSHEHHRLRRAALGPFFSKRTVQELEGSIKEKTEKLCVRLRQSAKKQETVELTTAFTAATMDVVSEYCYGKCHDCLDEEDYGKRWKLLMRGVFDTIPLSKHFPIVPQVLQSLPRSAVAVVNPVFSMLFDIRDLINVQAEKICGEEETRKRGGEHTTDEEKPKTVFHGILQSKLPESEKALWRMNDEAYVLITAGSETTARVLAVILSYVLQDKTLFIRLRKALDDVVGSSGLPPSRQLEEIPLMKAMVQEGLRIAEPATTRQVLIAPDEDLVCGDTVIPRGTPTSMSYGSVIFDPNIFPEPRSFVPDRWIRAAEKGQRLDQYLVTFQKGNRNCVGENLALAEMYLIIAAVVTRFDMELVEFDRARDLEVVSDLLVGMPSKESKGLRVKIRERE